MQRFLEYLELILTAAGVVVIMAVFAIFRNMTPWRAAAICALAVGVLHGAIFFAVRSAQRRARHHAIRMIRYKLNDAIVEKVRLALLAAEFPNECANLDANDVFAEIESSLAIIEAETLMDRSRYPVSPPQTIGRNRL